MKRVFEAVISVIRREWFLIVAGGIAGLIIYLFEKF
jgi:hypothetical protein